MRVERNIRLAEYTTIGIGGKADYFIRVDNEDALRDAIDYCETLGESPLVLGGGSNLLVNDRIQLEQPVIKMEIEGLERSLTDDGKVRLVVGAGMVWDDLVKYTVEEGLQGIECLSGIPGTVGASPIQNIGAYGQEVRETIAWVEGMDLLTAEVVRFTNEQCEFRYRWSRFKMNGLHRIVVTRVAFDLVPNGMPCVRYGDVTRYLEERGVTQPTLADVRHAVLTVRRMKGMVVDPEISDSRSCGSFFMNPIVLAEKAAEVERIARSAGVMRDDETMPIYPAEEGWVKLSAAWLMERAGLRRGQSHGNVGLSTRHILAIVNRGGGTSSEVIELVHHVRMTVHDRFGVVLCPEPVFVEFPPFNPAELDEMDPENLDVLEDYDFDSDDE